MQEQYPKSAILAKIGRGGFGRRSGSQHPRGIYIYEIPHICAAAAGGHPKMPKEADGREKSDGLL